MTAPTIRKDAPPFVRFEYMECGTDLPQSATAGSRIPLIKAYALIMQYGSKDVVEKDAEEWLASIKQRAIQGQYNPEWATRFQMQYDEFLKGNELPRHGTPVRTWPAPNREQVIRLQAVGITTVEDLAAVSDSALQSIGLDGRYLRDLARNYLEESKGVGALAVKVAELEQTKRDQAEQIKRMEAQLADFAAQLQQRKKAA